MTKPSPLHLRLRLVRTAIAAQDLEAVRQLLAYQIDMFNRRIVERPERYVWTNMAMPQELFYAMDLVPVTSEMLSGWLSSLGFSEPLLNGVEERLSRGLCSYHKVAVGALDQELLPEPRALVMSSNVCDGSGKMADYLADRRGIPYFLLDVPTTPGDDATAYVEQQLRELVAFLERTTGARLPPGRLEQAVARSNEARRHWIAAHELRRARPVMSGSHGFRNLFGTTFLFGTEEAVEITRALEEELAARLEARAFRHGERDPRLLWIHFAPLYKNELLAYVERDLGAAVVCDITSHVWWEPIDEEEPLRGLARKALAHHYLGGPEVRRKVYEEIARRYRIDGAVHFMHMGCRPIAGAVRTVKDTMERIGVPLLELGGDCIDGRNYAEGQLKTRLEAFIEMLRG